MKVTNLKVPVSDVMVRVVFPTILYMWGYGILQQGHYRTSVMKKRIRPYMIRKKTMEASSIF